MNFISPSIYILICNNFSHNKYYTNISYNELAFIYDYTIFGSEMFLLRNDWLLSWRI